MVFGLFCGIVYSLAVDGRVFGGVSDVNHKGLSYPKSNLLYGVDWRWCRWCVQVPKNCWVLDSFQSLSAVHKISIGQGAPADFMEHCCCVSWHLVYESLLWAWWPPVTAATYAYESWRSSNNISPAAPSTHDRRPLPRGFVDKNWSTNLLLCWDWDLYV